MYSPPLWRLLYFCITFLRYLSPTAELSSLVYSFFHSRNFAFFLTLSFGKSILKLINLLYNFPTLLPQTSNSISSGRNKYFISDSSVTTLKPFLNALNCFETDLFNKKSAYKSTNCYTDEKTTSKNYYSV